MEHHANGLVDTMILEKGSQLSPRTAELITAISTPLTGALMLALTNTQSTVFLRADYEFYLISSEPYAYASERIQKQNWEFSVNHSPYYIYHLTMSNWREFNSGYDGKVVINKTNNNRMFIAITDRYAKGL